MSKVGWMLAYIHSSKGVQEKFDKELDALDFESVTFMSDFWAMCYRWSLAAWSAGFGGGKSHAEMFHELLITLQVNAAIEMVLEAIEEQIERQG